MVTGQLYHIEILKKRIKDIQSRNPNYSLRAFAKSLNIDPSSMSKILMGKRNLPASSLSDVLKVLKLSQEEEKQFIDSISEAQKKKFTKKISAPDPIILTEETYAEIIRNWEYYAILNLIELDNFESTHEHISQRLGINQKIVEEMIQLLLKVDLIKLNKNGDWIRTHRSITTSNEIPSTILKEAHIQEIELAKTAIYKRAISETGFYSLTVNSNQDAINRVKKQCFAFLKKISQELESERKDDVFQVGIQLFPLTIKEQQP